MLTVKEAAEYVAKRLDRTEFPISTIKSWLASGKLPSQKVGDRLFIEVKDLDIFLPER